MKKWRVDGGFDQNSHKCFVTFDVEAKDLGKAHDLAMEVFEGKLTIFTVALVPPEEE